MNILTKNNQVMSVIPYGSWYRLARVTYFFMSGGYNLWEIYHLETNHYMEKWLVLHFSFHACIVDGSAQGWF